MDSDDFNKIINKETTSFNEMTITDNDDNEIINEYENFTNEKIEGAISSVKQVENDQEEEEIPILDDLIQAYSSPTTSLHDIENKETKLQNLIDVFTDKDDNELIKNPIIKEKTDEELTSTQFMKQVKIFNYI